MAVLRRVIRELPLALASPFLSAGALLLLWLTDLAHWAFARPRHGSPQKPESDAASIVIPNWNGRDLLEKYLPSVIAASDRHPGSEVIVVDNGSTDGSADFVRQQFPSVRLLALEQNLGFGGGSNHGFRQARHDVVVLLNSDMRVAPDFLTHLLQGFTDERVFAVSCQIFFSDPDRIREETGLTEGWWAQGGLRVGHRIDDQVNDLFPCFYGGGGSCAFHRQKFLELGGFDELFRPFYFEDTDLGYLAWKRGWKVLYQPKSHVWHEHRGTIGRKFTKDYIDTVLKKNYLLFTWKNIHEPGRLLASFAFGLGFAATQLVLGESPQMFSFSGLFQACRQLPDALRARWRARSLARISDTEAFRRPLGGYFSDRFHVPLSSQKLSVLFLSPYPIAPPAHGGAVFMNQTIRELGRHTELHLLVLLDAATEEIGHAELSPYCASMEFMVRMEGAPKGAASIEPYAVREFSNRDLLWRLHRTMYNRRVDVLQIEYTHMGQYAPSFRRIAVALFEHDIYFQSISRGPAGLRSVWSKIAAFTEYLRALRYELQLLPKVDQVQVCTPQNAEYLFSYLPELRSKTRYDLRAGIDTTAYQYRTDSRQPGTLLFLGSFRHLPNLEALNWFAEEIMPLILAQEPTAHLNVIGANAPARYTLPDLGKSLTLTGFVADVKEPLASHAIFVCPILSGSGVRVKLLEAFAAGIPVVSTRIGAEGLASVDGEVCALADSPADFATKVVKLLRDPLAAAQMAQRAHDYVVAERDMAGMTERLANSYRELVDRKRTTSSSLQSSPADG